MSLTVFALALTTLSPEPGAPPQDVLQVRAREILLPDGSRLEDGVLVVEEGRIARLGRGVEVDPDLPLIEHDGVLTPGFIACRTWSGVDEEKHDSTRSLLSEARMTDAFEPGHRQLEEALGQGITSVVLAPSEANAAGGLTAVVKTTGRVVRDEAHLALSFKRDALEQTAPSFFFFGSAEEIAHPPSDGHGHLDEEPHDHASDDEAEHEHEQLDEALEGLEETSVSRRGSRFPTSYPGLVRLLRERFSEGAGPYGRARRGELPVLLAAGDRHEAARALAFAREQELRGALVGASLFDDPDLVRLVGDSGLAVVVGPFALGQRRSVLESVQVLQEAKVPLAFALDGPGRDALALRLSAALALGAGADAAGLLVAMTSDAARVAGVDERLGSLERGKDADFVLWSGDPLDLSSRPEAVYVDGRLAFEGEGETVTR